MDTKSVFHKIISGVLFMTFCVSCTSVKSPMEPTAIISMPQDGFSFEETCLPEARTTHLSDKDFLGQLVVRESGAYSLYSPSTNKRFPLGEGMFPISVSPDNKKLAVITRDLSLSITKLLILKSDNILTKSIEWQSDWNLPIRWLDAERLIITKSDPGSLIILDINSGLLQKIDFPYKEDIYFEYGSAKIRTGFIAFDSKLTKEIYEGHGHVFILRDNETLSNGVIWAKRNFANWAEPVWAPNYTQIAVPLSNSMNIDDLYIVDAYGEEGRITDFQEAYHSPTSTTIYSLNWSPDSVFIAMQLDLRVSATEPPKKINGQLAGRLLVVELNKKQVVDYCMVYSHAPIWSPDGKYVAVDNILVDLADKVAYKLLAQGHIVGWLSDK